MNKIASSFFICLFGLSTAMAETVASGLPSIDANALGDKRLFFNGHQRQFKDNNTDKNRQSDALVESPGATNRATQTPIQSGSGETLLRYTGVVSSQRGVQLLLNGVPWQPGRFNVARVRLQPSTQLIEVSMIGGDQYRLLPGDAVALTP